jgi:hypothetical protein
MFRCRCIQTTAVKALPVNLPEDLILGSNGVANPVTVVHHILDFPEGKEENKSFSCCDPSRSPEHGRSIRNRLKRW